MVLSALPPPPRVCIYESNQGVFAVTEAKHNGGGMAAGLAGLSLTYVDCRRFRTKIATCYPYHQVEAP